MSTLNEQERIDRLVRDVVATLGPRFESLVWDYLVQLRAWMSQDRSPADQVVDDGQQAVHDRFIDTVWPACPRHPNHPLWMKDGWWYCERDATPIVRVGELQALRGD